MKKAVFLLSCFILVSVQAGPIMGQDSNPAGKAAQSSEGGIFKSFETRIKNLEDKIKDAAGLEEGSDKWYKRISLSGVIEVEAGYEETDFRDPAVEDEKSSDADLSAAELAVDAQIAEHVDGHVLFKYEDDDVFVDEGFITLSGTKSFPAYLTAGRQYVPFGNFETHFVTDPATLVLGETNEGAAVAGYMFCDEKIDVSLGAFNGKVGKEGDDDTIDSFVASLVAQPCEAFVAGVSYISNLASSDALSDVVQDTDGDGEIGPLYDLVGGWSAFATLRFLDRFTLIGEYVSALDSFKAGELYDPAETKDRKPAAWNLELGASITDSIELAVRYGGSDDGGPGPDFLPESQYGAVLNLGIMENTNLAFEYLHSEFEDDTQEVDSFVVQLAVEF